MTKRQIWTVAAMFLGAGVLLFAFFQFLSRDGSRPVDKKEPVSTQPGSPDEASHSWPEQTSDPWPVQAKTFATKEQALAATVSALFDPRGVRYGDLARVSCRHEQPYQAFRMGFESDWRRGPIPIGSGLPRIAYSDFAVLIAEPATPLEAKWSLAHQGRGVRGDETQVVAVTWQTKPDAAGVGRVQLSLSFYSPEPNSGGWCFRGLAGGMVQGR